MQEGTIPGAGGVPVHFRKFGNSRRALLIPNAAWLGDDLESLAQDRTVVFYDPRGRGNSGPLPDETPATLDRRRRSPAGRCHCPRAGSPVPEGAVGLPQLV